MRANAFCIHPVAVFHVIFADDARPDITGARTCSILFPTIPKVAAPAPGKTENGTVARSVDQLAPSPPSALLKPSDICPTSSH